ncbi:MAG: hypothetical protein WCK65_15275 [Rhodospirillaceae bacterium]
MFSNAFTKKSTRRDGTPPLVAERVGEPSTTEGVPGEDAVGAGLEPKGIELEGGNQGVPMSPEDGSKPNQAAPGADSIKRFGEQLVGLGLLTQDQLDVALHEKQRCGKMLGAVLVDLGFITDNKLSEFLSDRTGFETFISATTVIDPDVIGYLPKQIATRYRILPISISDDAVTVVAADPL